MSVIVKRYLIGLIVLFIGFVLFLIMIVVPGGQWAALLVSQVIAMGIVLILNARKVHHAR